MNVVLFEDSAVDQLFPITLTRPAYGMTCGSLRLVDIASALSANIHGIERSYLSPFQSDYFEPSEFDSTCPTLWLNARLCPDARLIPLLRSESTSAGSWCSMQNGQVAIARTEAGSGPDLSTSDQATVLDFLACQLPSRQLEAQLLEYPHHVVAQHSQVMAANIDFRAGHGDYEEVADGVFAPAGYVLPEHVVFDTMKGPIVLERGVSIGAFSVIRGPTYLATNVMVAPHTLIKGTVSVGHTTKVGGELSVSILEPYSNKLHFGYLGSSYVGSWVNLGAGTTNSNLKNTYGSIRVQYGNQKIDTGMQFMGCVIGDYSKTAIHTSIYTGKMIGACSNVYGTVTTNVPSFANYARSFGEVTEQPADVMEATQKRVFCRRNIEQEPRHIALLRAIYAIEAPKRKLANQPLSL